ncbi:MAG TPA: mechanosensitive ion channel family protein [Kofleriaceae bacterium]|jgi:MscS family membrane protein|nr:mechanosensitive ion channel family protein [Kofleriaceae bacterium]
MLTQLVASLTAPWTITVAAVVIAFLVGRVIVRLARPLLTRMAGRTSVDWDDRLVELMAWPLSLVLALQVLRIASPWLPLDTRATTTLNNAVAIVTTLAVLWTAFRGIDLGRSVLERRSWAIDRPSSRSLLSIGGRLAKVAVLVIAGIVALAQLGVSVASLIAGLGIGGLAVALAAQKTLENLFGTLSIGVDQPMREGDTVKLYDFTGTVEQIGLRSTRIRTVDRTIVTIPNGELANQRIESFTVRDRLRFATTIGLTYGTTAQQIREIRGEIDAILRRHPKVSPDTVGVWFKELAASALVLEVSALFQTTDWNEFVAIRQDLLLAFLTAIEQHGSAIAFPTQTVHFVGSQPSSPAPLTHDRSATGQR